MNTKRAHFQENKKYLIGAIIGNACEWYDYAVYASLAPILSTIFFSTKNHFPSLILTFAVFAFGFLIRPLGGIIFGNIADRDGRKNALIHSILLMAIPSLAIGLLPGYNKIGFLSPLLLLIFRLLQGLAVGGEYPIIIAYIGELSVPKNRGYISSYASVTTVTGAFLATVMVAIITKLFSHAQIVNYAWRIPFFITSITTVIVYFIRKKLPESLVFSLSKDIHNKPIANAFKTNKSAIVKIFFYLICIAIAYYTFNFFSTTYFTSILKLDYLTALYIASFSMLFLIIILPIIGYLSDIYGRKKITLTGIIGIVVLIFPIYFYLSKNILLVSLCSQLLFSILIGLYLAPLPAMLSEQINTNVRCSSIALGYNMALAIFGGSAPMVNMFIIAHLHSNLAPSLYLMLAGTLSLTATFFMKDLTGKPLP